MASPANLLNDLKPCVDQFPTRLGILGAGAITQEAHLPAAALVPNVQIVVVADPSAAACKTVRDMGYQGTIEQSSAETFLSNSSLLNSLSLDGVIVALPNYLHESVVKKALETRLHVLCEKPLALSVNECKRIEAATLMYDRKVAVGMVRRFFPSTQVAREVLNQRLIGSIKGIELSDGLPYAWGADSGAAFDSRGGGIMAAVGVHYLDLVQSLFGALTPLEYRDDFGGGCEANADFRLRTASGIPIHLRLSYEHGLENEIRIMGDAGDLIIGIHDNSGALWHQRNVFPNLEVMLRPKKPYLNSRWDHALGGFAQQIWEFTAAIRNNTPVAVPVADAIGVTELIEWAYRSRKAVHQRSISGQRPTLLPSSVVVTGGTGFVGVRLVERLAELDCSPITIPVRNYRTCVSAARFAVTLRRSNLLSMESVRNVVKGARYVFHLAYGKDGRNSKEITIEGTRNVVDAAIEAKVECVVIMSTLDVFGNPVSEHPLDESCRYAAKGDSYRLAKRGAEEWSVKRSKTSGTTRIVILLPGCVYGPRGEAFVNLPLSLAKGGSFCWVEEGKGIANYVYVDNLVDAAILAASTDAAHGKRLIVSDGWCTWREFIEPLLGPYARDVRSFGEAQLRTLRPSPLRAGFQDLIRAMAGSVEVIDVLNRMPVVGAAKQWLVRHFPNLRRSLKSAPKPLLGALAVEPGKVPPATFLAEFMGPSSARFSSEMARHVLGWSSLVSLREGQRYTVRWLEENRKF